MTSNVKWFRDIRMSDLPQVGGKNASLGEMVGELGRLGVRVPDGFATTADAYRRFLSEGSLAHRIAQTVAELDTADVNELARVGSMIRGWVRAQPFPADLEADIRAAYAELGSDPDVSDSVTWAVRSSATAEDLPSASFAGQQETFLHISRIDNVLEAIRDVFASLFTDRALVYRAQRGFDTDSVAISAGVQRMVRSDLAASGVIFTIDTESGFEDVVLVTSSYGLGETVVQGMVDPDEFCVYKPALDAGRPAVIRREVGAKSVAMRYAPGSRVGVSTTLIDVPAADRAHFSITDEQVEELARHAVVIERHYGRPMDIEWALDGIDGLLYIVQARPETVAAQRDHSTLERWRLHAHGHELTTGRAVGERIGAGRARVLHGVDEMHLLEPGDVLVAERTDPDWEPVMQKASAIVTDRGGRTCHAAIVARELGKPAVVGTGDATRSIANGGDVTVSCAEGEVGRVYEGALPFSVERKAVESTVPLPVKLMLNVAIPDQAFTLAQLPNDGVGLARLEFIVGSMIGVHPRAVLDIDKLDTKTAAAVRTRAAAYASPREFYVQRLTEGIATIAAAFFPKPVIVRLSDFKTNEYAGLIGGEAFEPRDENPMLGWRGASRYTTPSFAECFALECEAIVRVRDRIGLTNVGVMIPFVRTPREAEATVQSLGAHGLARGVDGLDVLMMCEIPSNALRADAFLDHVDGFSIGSNDLTQLTLGVDRDSEDVAAAFDERDPAVLELLERAIGACTRRGKYVGICGQGPSDHPDLARWLVEHGTGSLSLNSDAILDTRALLADAAVLAPRTAEPVGG